MTINYKTIKGYDQRRFEVVSLIEGGVKNLPLKPYHIFLKLITGITFLTTSFAATSLGAAEKYSVKAVKKAAKNTRPCWKRTKAFDDDGNAPICKAFERILKTTCESPDQVSCNWTLPSVDNRFIKLQWEPLDWKKYWDLIADINKTGVREDLRANLWNKEEASERREFEEGHRSLHITYVDIDNNGMSEQVVRYDLLPCHKLAGTMFGVMVPATKRLDWRFRYLFLDVNSSDGANIMLFNGMTFMFGWQSGWGKLFIWKGSPGTDSRGRRNICQFKHCKGGRELW